MLAKLRKRLTFANVVSLIALFVALGGSSYAAITITGKNVKNSSLTGADIKNSSLTGADIKNSSLTGADVKDSSLSTSDIKNHSLLSTDFKPGQIPAGPRGADGRNGTNGFGVLAYPAVVDPVASGTGTDFDVVSCGAGTYPTGGDAVAFDPSDPATPQPNVIIDQGIAFDNSGNPAGYFADWNKGSTNLNVEVDAVCANATTVRPNGKRAHFHAAKRLR